MPGALAGRATRNSRSASVPPVEAPTATMISVVLAMAPCAAGGSMASAVSFGAGAFRLGATGSALARLGPRRARAALFTVSQISIACSARWSAAPIFGFRMTSTAPASRVCISVSEPSSISEEHITTGMGCWAISFLRKVMPSMRGISTSSVMTSGMSSLRRLAATKGSEATPITSISGSFPRMSDNVCLTEAESSTMRTRMRFWLVNVISFKKRATLDPLDLS